MFLSTNKLSEAYLVTVNFIYLMLLKVSKAECNCEESSNIVTRVMKHKQYASLIGYTKSVDSKSCVISHQCVK